MDNCYELDRLIREQARDMRSRHVIKTGAAKKRESNMCPMLMDEMFTSDHKPAYSDRLSQGFNIVSQAADND